MAITKAKKETMLKKINEEMRIAKSVVFSQYAGTNVAQITDLRRKARESNIKIAVTKKTLVRIAAKENGYPDISEEVMSGPVLLAFGPDEVSAAKFLKTFGKQVETVKLIGGLLEGKILGLTEINNLANMPSKQELLAQFMGMLQSPLRNFASMLNSPLAAFARAAKAYGEKKQ
ncbi:MAG: 50S ribosomal protein L10p, large subunit ribosomal protein L10 [Candidatus Peregrinibacteria bacterium GW2011_GWF2_33_10]|nr:MAG: 50S ribosomal protein L10p, large subunit ribosomal protein L10 [Candidatus Peregrinibacteria bacterium GW2011_GWF2_33_10]OGJ45327.1 MAG: 50S ribosomal protein L10 [Candidatus Peregrinibacteria bacterium RIFOXYA12_FULL_33_12]OGJ45381.1 MAG: 50S ribosomal protein L10 [Candidatus Peregrinibacteria bacterium RIFOXYA2_FULL_33_21]OGJ50984.1 MAG: 50S ribosomal protein L10 [Candidatus Peregrinibacteria bacterium RIFOXYB2_FULL_33_20]